MERNLLSDHVVVDRDGADFNYQLVFRAILWDDQKQEEREKLTKICKFNFQVMSKWANHERQGGYVPRMPHDQVIDKDIFTEKYRKLKEKYGYWAEQWEESTDPQKFIFEDIGIASFLICLWEKELQEFSRKQKQSFVDLGAGNGFLVYLLAMEGYQGRGIDLQKRKVWDKYPSNVKLIKEAIDPLTSVYNEDWIIANHADELTPWTPLIASRHIFSIGDDPEHHQLAQRYMLLPCCEWDFDKKFSKKKKNLSRFHTYLEYLSDIGTKLGFKVETENLRIPSTRNIAQVGRFRSRLYDKQKEEEILKIAKFKQFVPKFREESQHRG